MNKKKKILAILPSKVLYGKERSNIEVYNIIKNFENVELKVLVNKDCDESLIKGLYGLDFDLVKYPNRIRKRNRYLGFVYDFFICNILYYRMLVQYRPDVLLLNSEVNFYDLFPVFLRYKGKIILRFGDQPAFNSLAFKWFNSFIWYKFIIKRVDVIVSISKFIKNAVDNLGRINGNDLIIYNYPPTRNVLNHKNEEAFYKDLELDIVFGYLGQITKAKGVENLIESAISLINTSQKRIKFLVAGNIFYDKEFGDKITKMLSNIPNSKIELIGEITDVNLFFDNIDVLCVPSIVEEALGNVIVEAKLNSVPCIVFPSGGMPELINHQVDGFICSEKSTIGLLEGLNYYINNLDLIPVQANNSKSSMNTLGIDRKVFVDKWKSVLELK